MSYDHKIIDQKYHLKGLINKNTCNQLIQFYEDNLSDVTKEGSYKFNQDSSLNTKVEDNCGFLDISLHKNEKKYEQTYTTILKYLRTVLVNYEIYIRNNFCPTYENVFMTKTDNIRIIKYGKGELIKDHTDVSGTTRGSLTINLNDDYKGGEFRFFGGRVKVALSAGEAMLFPAEPIWIHGTEPVIKGARYTINCFLKQ